MGVILDPANGCHVTIRNPQPNMTERSFVGIYRDSAMVAYRHHEEVVRDGRRMVSIHTYANKVVLHPLRPIGGKPCPGMLLSVS
ncbi:MAG: hypothetical protein F4087_16285 [Gemmatimonadetes bacterium]|nr:hypothetical protein [Gemmatimonadota bacterium]MYE70061.1 hypothetical protein [Gemmatimonadota bacterium]MYJ70050.1 hypothetical protein [Gemmatimonadota bacterium]